MQQYEDQRRPLIKAAGPGHWNDPDMILGGNFGISYDQTKVQFGLWAMHASPLILSVDLATIRPEMTEVQFNSFQAFFNHCIFSRFFNRNT